MNRDIRENNVFTSTDIRAHVHERPFRPFRLTTSAGQIFDVYHPDLIMVGRHFLIIGMPAGDDPVVAERVTRVFILHVSTIEDLPMPSASRPGPDTNGSAG